MMLKPGPSFDRVGQAKVQERLPVVLLHQCEEKGSTDYKVLGARW